MCACECTCVCVCTHMCMCEDRCTYVHVHGVCVCVCWGLSGVIGGPNGPGAEFLGFPQPPQLSPDFVLDPRGGATTTLLLGFTSDSPGQEM